MADVTLVQNGKATPEGERLIEWLDAICKKAEDDEQLSFAGHIGHYYVNAYKGGGVGFGMSREQWMTEMATPAQAAYRDMEYLSEQAEQAQEQVDQTNAIVEQLEALEANLKAVQKELRAEKKARKALEAQLTEQTEAQAEIEPEPDDDQDADSEEA